MEALRHANRPSEHLRALQQSALLLSFKGGEEGWALTDSRNHYNLLRGGGWPAASGVFEWKSIGH